MSKQNKSTTRKNNKDNSFTDLIFVLFGIMLFWGIFADGGFIHQKYDISPKPIKDYSNSINYQNKEYQGKATTPINDIGYIEVQ